MTTHRSIDIAVFFLAPSIAVLAGCAHSALPPPIAVSYRESIFGNGQVVVITNNSNHHLYNVLVVGRSLKEGSSASIVATDHLIPGSSIEVGWLEFGSWVPQPGETIEVYADNYVLPYLSVIPEP